MSRRILWNRRKFLQRLGYFSALGSLSPIRTWSYSKDSTPFQGRYQNERRSDPSIAYIASRQDEIQVFSTEQRGWKLLQTIPSPKPSYLALHPSRRIIYAANEIDEYEGLPRGTVEAYRIDPQDGQITLLNRQPLSLSATAPKHLCISPDGSQLVVAAHGGGSYNVIPIRRDGSLDRVSGILKAVGSGPDQERQSTAHPQMMLFAPNQYHLISADLGCDSLNVFTLAEDRPVAEYRRRVEPGSGPRFLALHPSNRLLYVVNALNASISCYGYDAANARILDCLYQHNLDAISSLRASAMTSMAMHPSGKFLVTSCSRSIPGIPTRNRIASWHIDAATGKLDLIQESTGKIVSSPIESTTITHNALFILSQQEGIFRADLDAASGLFDDEVRVAKVSAPSGILLHHL